MGWITLQYQGTVQFLHSRPVNVIDFAAITPLNGGAHTMVVAAKQADANTRFVKDADDNRKLINGPAPEGFTEIRGNLIPAELYEMTKPELVAMVEQFLGQEIG